MKIKKKKNKFVAPQEWNQSSIFAQGGNIYAGTQLGSNQMTIFENFGKNGNTQAGIGQALGTAQGVMQLGSQTMNNLSTEGIGNEVIGTNDMSRDDIINTNVNIDSRQTNAGGQALSGAMTGAQAGMAFGPLGAAIGGGVGALAGGISSLFGNNKKQKAAERAEQQWTNNLEAKNRQFQGQDLRTSMANFSANGGDLNTYAYGGQMPSQLTSFQSGGSHESNPNGGILQGTGANGQPNLVEEGETKHEDYIFSDRLKINPQISKDFKLPNGLNGKTFAAASKYLNKEAKERPNDPISNNAVKAHLAKLTAAQEGLKEQMQPQQGIPMEGQPNANMLAQGYANGGLIDQTHYQNPTLQGANINAMGGNIYSGEATKSNQMSMEPLQTIENTFDTPDYSNDAEMNALLTKQKAIGSAAINPKYTMASAGDSTAYANANEMNFANSRMFDNSIQKGPGLFDKLSSSMKGKDYSRYAPAAANIAMGISDMFEKPEVVKYGRVNPERVTARMDYQPIDTEWMNNKMNATYAGTRDQMINQAGGNRAMAMAGLAGINQQQQNAVGESYLKAQDINYGRKSQATQFNAGIEAQNVAAQNAAQQTNLQLQMQEMDANARNRAAKRNAARQAILNAASNIGDIGRENYFSRTAEKTFGYDKEGNFTSKDGKKYDKSGKLIG